MKKYWIFILAILIVIIASIGFIFLTTLFSNSKKVNAVNYFLPNHFEGCAVIIYNVPEAKPLTLTEDGVLDYYFNNEGVLETSSPQDFGWEGQKHSGFHKTYFHIGDKLIKDDEVYDLINSHSIGETTSAELGTVQYEIISIGMKDACSDNFIDAVLKEHLLKNE